MKTLKFISQTAMVAAATIMLSLFYTGCKKQDATPSSENKTTTLTSDDAIGIGIDNNLLASSFDDVFTVSDEATGVVTAVPLPGSTTSSDCRSVSNDNGIVTINFGNEPCLGQDGNYRSGIITVQGSTITFTNYALNFNTMNGTISTINTGLNDLGHQTWMINVKGSVTTSPIYDLDGKSKTMSFTANWSREVVGVNADGNRIYAIHGSASGLTASGIHYTATIDKSNPLMKYPLFQFYSCGLMSFSVNAEKPIDGSLATARMQEGQTFDVDYGYMDCQKDNLAKVIMDDGRSYAFELTKSAK